MPATIFWIALSLILFSIFELLRRKFISEKYAIVWIALGFMLILGAVLPDQVNKISQFLGFQVLSNFVLFIFALVNLFIIMQLSFGLGKTESQIQTLAEELALLKSTIKNEIND